jgi:hypothetical protein
MKLFPPSWDLLAVSLYNGRTNLLELARAGRDRRAVTRETKPLGRRLSKVIVKHLVPLFGLMSLTAYFGCRTLYTTVDSPESGAVNGMLYYLPIGKITIKGEFKDVTPTPTPCPTCPPKPKIEKNALNDKDSSAQATASPAAMASPPGTGGEQTGQMIGSASQLAITMTQEVEADERRVFHAQPKFNPVYEDEVKVAVNAKHLLSTGNVTTEDKTVEIVGALASLATQVKALTEGAPPPPAKSRLPFYFSFHPSDQDEVGRVKTALVARGINFSLDPTPGGKAIVISDEQAKKLGENGLLFRPVISYKVTLVYQPQNEQNPRNLELIHTTQQFVLPDLDRLYAIAYPRMAFVKKVKDIGFTDGMLTDFHQKVPSPILGFLGIPKAVLQAIVPIPGAPGPSGSASSSGTTGSR